MLNLFENQNSVLVLIFILYGLRPSLNIHNIVLDLLNLLTIDKLWGTICFYTTIQTQYNQTATLNKHCSGCFL